MRTYRLVNSSVLNVAPQDPVVYFDEICKFYADKKKPPTRYLEKLAMRAETEEHMQKVKVCHALVWLTNY